jgi:hypothetical protein
MANRPGDDRLEAAQNMRQAGIGSLSGRPLSPKFNYPRIPYQDKEERILNDYLDERNIPGTGEIWPGRPEQGRGGIGEGSFWNVRADQPWQDSGVMLAMANSPAVNKMKNIYSQFDPFFPNVDPGDQQIGYDFDKNLWGGTLGFGGGYDIDDEDYNAYINWGTNW